MRLLFRIFFLLPLFHERARITLLLLNRTRENFISYFARVTVAPAFLTSYTFLTQFVATAELVFEFSYLSLSLFLFLSSPSSHTNLSPRHPSSSFPSFVHISSTHVIGSIRGVPINPQGVSLDRWLTENTIVYHTDPLSLYMRYHHRLIHYPVHNTRH